jgi:hypothetical protein
MDALARYGRDQASDSPAARFRYERSRGSAAEISGVETLRRPSRRSSDLLSITGPCLDLAIERPALRGERAYRYQATRGPSAST